MPAPKRAVMDCSSMEMSWLKRAMSTLMTLSNFPRSGRRPPTTLVPPENGTTAIPSLEQYCRIASSSSSLAGATIASGAGTVSLLAKESWSAEDLPAARRRRCSCSVVTYSSPTILARPAKCSAEMRDSSSFTWELSRLGVASPLMPKTFTRSFLRSSPRGLAFSGVPHRL